MRPRHNHGFTIVELLIVIVVIAILAAITIVAYNGIQNRARDAQRLSDITAIAKALESYKAQTGSYPTAVGNSVGGWEISSNQTETMPFASTCDSWSSIKSTGWPCKYRRYERQDQKYTLITATQQVPMVVHPHFTY